MRDFTLAVFQEMLASFQAADYRFLTFDAFRRVKLFDDKVLVLRHDIDQQPRKALTMAMLEHSMGIQGTYYVRNTAHAFDSGIVKAIASLKHEIGYHYEDLSRNKGNKQQAMTDFSAFLDKLRQLYPVRTICMHGSPLSAIDNRDLWKHYDYKKLGIEAEFYLDTDFKDILYLTDTGRKWNSPYNLRDKVTSSVTFPVRDTFHMIRCIQEVCMPGKIMITLHPQRWNNNWSEWLLEYGFQIGRAHV